MREAIELCERIAGRELHWTLGEAPRIGDHRWWISDLDEFKRDYPGWSLEYDVEEILGEIYEQNVEQWTVPA
jgi:CDP-paratose 2-epimerase